MLVLHYMDYFKDVKWSFGTWRPTGKEWFQPCSDPGVTEAKDRLTKSEDNSSTDNFKRNRMLEKPSSKPSRNALKLSDKPAIVLSHPEGPPSATLGYLTEERISSISLDV